MHCHLESVKSINCRGHHCGYGSGKLQQDSKKNNYFYVFDFHQFVRRNLEPYVLDNADVFKCSVIYLNTMDPLQYIQEPVDNLTGSENIRISFIARKSGNYQIRLTINDKLIGGIQYMRSYQSGKICSDLCFSVFHLCFILQVLLILVEQFFPFQNSLSSQDVMSTKVCCSVQRTSMTT